MASVNKDILNDLGAEPDLTDFSDLGAEPVDAQAQPAEPGLGEQVMSAVEQSFPNAVPMTKELGKKLFSAAEGTEELAAQPFHGEDPNDTIVTGALKVLANAGKMNAMNLDPAAKAGFVLQGTMQSIYDEGGEITATRLATAGVNPYIAAGVGSVIQNLPDIAFSLEGLAAIKAAGNARAESEILNSVFKKSGKALEYKGPIETPTTILEGGESAIPLGTKELGLLKGEKSLPALEGPKVVEGPMPKGTMYHGTKGKVAEGDFPGTFTTLDPEQAKYYGELKGFKDKEGLKYLDYDSDDAEKIVKQYMKKHPEEVQLGGDDLDVFHFPSKSWEEFITKKGYAGTILGDTKYTVNRNLLEEVNPGFTMRDKPDLAKIQSQNPELAPKFDPMSGSKKGAQPTYPKDIKGPSKKFELVPAFKLPDGKILSGKPGNVHMDLVDKLVKKVGKPGEAMEDVLDRIKDEDSGFYDNVSKKFYPGNTAHEKFKLLDASDPKIEGINNKVNPGESLLQYAKRKKLNADVPEFPQIEKNVAPADRYNPAVSELVDESRRQYSGVSPKLDVTKDMETGQTTFKLKKDPELGKRVVTEAEHASNTTTKNSAAVKEMGIDPRIVDSSSVLPGSETVPNLKEGVVAGHSSWLQSAWNRIGVAAEDAVSRMGDFGKEMANGIRTSRDVPQVRYGEFSAGFDNFLKGTSKKQAKEISIALSDALEGRTPKNKLPEGMLEFVQQKLKVIAEEAEAIGLKVRNTSGEVLPFASRDNYFPRVLRQEIFDGLISGDDKVMREIAQNMVNNKQQPNFNVAFERVKYMRNKMMTNKYGHLERAREVELSPEFYDRNSLRVIPEYINSALHRIEEVRHFGVDGEKALEMLSGMQQQGHDAKLARTIFERFTRIEPRDSVYLRGAQGLRNVTAGMLIQAQSTALQLGQSMMPAYEAGVFNAIKGFAKSFTELGAAEAKKAGQVFNIAAEEYMKEAYGSGSYGFGHKFVDGVMKMTGFTRMDHFLRKYSALTAKEYIPSLVNKLIKNPGSTKATVELQHLGFDTGKILRNKGISVEELNVGAKRFADMTQGAPDNTRLPEFWTTPHGKLFGQFKNFSYIIGKQNASMIKRALQTGNVVRLGEMAVGLPMTGYVISELRKAMVGESNYEITGNEEVDQVIQVLANATAFGPSMDLMFQALQGPDRLKNFLLPISVSNAAEIVGSAGKSVKEADSEYLVKTLLKKTPVVGKILANQVYGE